MAQQPRTLTPYATPQRFLGAELCSWREYRGLSQAGLAREVYVSADLIAKVEKAGRNPAADLIRRCDHALGTAGALTRLLAFVDNQRHRRPGQAEPRKRTHFFRHRLTRFGSICTIIGFPRRFGRCLRRGGTPAAGQSACFLATLGTGQPVRPVRRRPYVACRKYAPSGRGIAEERRGGDRPIGYYVHVSPAVTRRDHSFGGRFVMRSALSSVAIERRRTLTAS